MGLFNSLFANNTTDFKALVQEGAKVIDVRSPEEFKAGHIQGSINIPLQVIEAKAPEIKSWGNTVVLCCASGNRSGMANKILKSKNINSHNGGGWQSLNAKLN